MKFKTQSNAKKSWTSASIVSACLSVCMLGCGANPTKRTAVTGKPVDTSNTGDPASTPGETPNASDPSASTSTGTGGSGGKTYSAPAGSLSGVPPIVTARPNIKILMTFTLIGVTDPKINAVLVSVPDSGIPDQTFQQDGSASAHVEIEVPGDVKAGSFNGSVQATGAGGALMGQSKFSVRVSP